MITVTLDITASPEKRGEILDILRSFLEPTRVQPGCISCRLYQDLENQNVIAYEEMWQTQADLDRHICSDNYRNILFVMEMSSESPEIKFNTISHSTGMESIEALRG